MEGHRSDPAAPEPISWEFRGGYNDFSVAAEVLHQEPQVRGGNPTQQDLAVMQLGSSAAVPVSVGACAFRGHVGERLVRDHSLSLSLFFCQVLE